MNFNEIAKEYETNYFDIEKLDDLLDDNNDFESWLASMKTRAKKLQEYYKINNEILDEIKEYAKEGFKDQDEANRVEDNIDRLYDEYMMDKEFLFPIVEKLILYYEEKKNIGKLIELYYVAFYLLNEGERRSSNLNAELTYQYKILSYKEHYKELPLVSRRKFFLVYYNLSSVCVGMNDTITPEESYHWYMEAKEFYYSPMVQALDGNTDRIIEIYNQIEYDWIAIIDRSDELSNEALLELFSLVSKLYNEEMENGSIYEMDSFVYSAYLEKERLLGNIGIEECIEKYLDYYRHNLNNPELEYTQESFYTILESPIAIERWLNYSSNSTFKSKVFHEINEAFMHNYKNYFGVVPTPFIHSVLAEWCECSIKYLNNAKEKEEAILNLIIKNQIPTYLHSVMVMKLSKLIFDASYKENKKLFDSLDMEYEELREFVKKSALLHDIGKVKITNIINMQGRRLSNMEFKGISLHPEFGMELLKEDKDLEKYIDIVLYHHKYYDGTKGYPIGDLNTKSKYRIIIDIVSLADSLDAATDDLGRNYKNSKNVLEVIDEFILGSGTRYNPYLVEIIKNNEPLIQEFITITKEKRPHYMYQAYMESKEIRKE